MGILGGELRIAAAAIALACGLAVVLTRRQRKLDVLRVVLGAVGAGLLALLGVDLATNHDTGRHGWATALVTGTTLISGAAFVESFFPTTTEHVAELWRNDPDLLKTRATSGIHVKPTVGLQGVGLIGTF